MSREELTYEASLKSIEDYLRTSDKIVMMTNQDEVILRPEDLDWLADVFGERGIIYPYGGHCGNMVFPDNVDFMIDFVSN